MEIPIIYEDESILVIDKPAGVLSLTDGYDRSLPHLATLLAPRFGRVWMVHRLDRDTSGALVLARSAAAHHNLNDQFRERRVDKRYHALVSPAPTWDRINAEYPLRKDGDRQHRTVVDPLRGKPAITEFSLLERFPHAALLEARPRTGYTHQIRAHLLALDCPILADTLYGFVSETPTVIGRLALHAYTLTFSHPTSGTQVNFTTPHPADFSAALEHLRATGGHK